MRIIGFLFFFFILMQISAQSIRFYGIVQDSTGKALFPASLVASHLKSKSFQGFAITDKQGMFELSFHKNQAYIVKLTFMGYQSVIDTIYTKETDILKNYVLYVDKQQLDGVEIKYEMPVTVKGDTIIYNADSFTTGNEKKLGDVLKKMPGIEVETDGTVKVEGKEVKKVMVEGKSFFEGDSKLASKNIPANAVKKVEVLRDYNENSQLRSFEDNEDSFAINIRLKEGKKNFWFGDITAGGGTDEHYLFHPKLFYYSPKRTYNFIGDLNNTGSAPMSFMDYYKMTGGFNNLMHKTGSNFESSSEILDFSLLPNDKAKAMQTQFSGFNYNYNLSNKLTWDGFLMLNRQETDMQSFYNKQYIPTGTIENSQNNIHQQHLSVVLKSGLKYEPNLDVTLNYDLLLKFNDLQQNNHYLSDIRAENRVYDRNESFSINHQLDYYKSLKNNNLITWSIQHNYNRNEPLLETVSTEEFFSTSSLINLSPQNTYDLLQNKYFNQQQITSVLDYYWVLNKTSHVDFSLGNEMVWQNFESKMFQLTDQDNHVLLDKPELINDASYTFVDVFAGAYYKILIDKVVIRPGISGHYYYLKDIQIAGTQTGTHWSLLPSVKIKYKMKRRGRISFSYRMTHTYPEIQKLAQAFVLNSYNSLSAGNRNLQNVLKHQFSLRYSLFKMSKFYHLFTGMTYNRSVHSIRNHTELIQTDLISYPVNLDNTDENWMAYANFSKRYVYWKYSLKANYNHAKYYNIINGSETESTSDFQNYQVNLNSNLSGFLNFDLSYGVSLNNFDNMTKNTLYITQKPSVGLELRMFKETTQINIKYDYFDYENDEKTVKNNYAFLSTDIYFQKEGSSWEFVLSGKNLLNNATLSKESLSDIYIATSKYYVMPAYWMLKLTYKL